MGKTQKKLGQESNNRSQKAKIERSIYIGFKEEQRK
jgi:hypothetical protein